MPTKSTNSEGGEEEGRKRGKTERSDFACVPFGWGGFLTRIPEDWKLGKIHGTHKRGGIVLVEGNIRRLELTWGSVSPQAASRAGVIGMRQIRDSLPKAERGDVEEKLERCEHAHFAPVLRHVSRRVHRYYGFSPATGRVWVMAFHRGARRTETLFETVVVPELREQPSDGPVRWAFFGIRLTVPAGYKLAAAMLNLGDMRLTLEGRGSWFQRRRLIIRQIYPAKLALTRQDLPAWLEALTKDLNPNYRPRRIGFRPRLLQWSPFTSSQGDGIYCDARLQLMVATLFRPFSFRAPLRMRAWLFRMKEPDRLVCVQISDREDRLDPQFSEVLRGLNWTEESLESK